MSQDLETGKTVLLDDDHSLDDIKKLEQEIAEKYKNPKNVEQFGNEPVPQKLKTVKWYDVFIIFASFFITPVHMMLPATMVLTHGCSFWGAVWSQTLGGMIAFTFAGIFAMTGTKYGIPGAAATRFSLGGNLSRIIPSVLRALTSIILFASQTIGGGVIIQTLLHYATGNKFNLVIISVIFAIFQTIIAIIGFEGLKKLTRVILPLKMLGMGYIAYALINSGIPEFAWSAVTQQPAASPGWTGFAISCSVAIGIFFTLITDTSDFCRYTRSNKDMFVGVVLGGGTSIFIAAFFGAYAAVAIQNWNVFEAMTLTNPSVFIAFFLILVVVLDNWSVNILNLYTAGLCLVNSVPKFGRFWWTVIAGVIATIASGFPVIVENLETIVNYFAVLYSPLVGVLIVDLLVFKKFKLDIREMMKPEGRYSYNGGVNILAVVVIVIGALLFNLWPPEILPALTNALVCMVLYYGLVKFFSPRWESLRIATTPFEENK